MNSMNGMLLVRKFTSYDIFCISGRQVNVWFTLCVLFSDRLVNDKNATLQFTSSTRLPNSFMLTDQDTYHAKLINLKFGFTREDECSWFFSDVQIPIVVKSLHGAHVLSMHLDMFSVHINIIYLSSTSTWSAQLSRKKHIFSVNCDMPQPCCVPSG